MKYVLLLTLLLIFSFLPVAQASASTVPVSAILKGPALIANSSTQAYKLIVEGGPSASGIGNYTYTATIHAKNTTGLSVSPISGSSALGVFYLNISSGPVAEVITVNFNITSGHGSSEVNVTRSFLITVIDPVVITVPVQNTGSVGVKDANVSLYVNGHYVGSQIVNLSAGQSTDVTFKWVAYSYPAGKNTATVVINSSSGLVFANGQSVTSFTIYIPGKSGTYIDDYLIVASIFAAVILVLLLLRKPKPRY